MKKLGMIISICALIYCTTPVRANDLLPDVDLGAPFVGVEAKEVINADYVGVGETVVISGTVNGDAYALGGQVVVDGQINGDLLVIGGNLTLNGLVTGNVRAMGGQITYGGSVGRNLSSLGGNLDVTSAAKITGNVLLAGGNLTLASPLPKDVKVAAGNLTLLNTIGGNVAAAIGQMTLTAKAKINGNLTYSSDADLSLAPGATIAGQIVKKTVPPVVGLSSGPDTIKAEVDKSLNQVMSKGRALAFLAALLSGLLIIYLLPNFAYTAITSLENRPWQALFTGLISVFIVPLIAFVLLLSVVGIPLSVLLLIMWGINFYFSQVVFGYWLGARMLNRLGRIGDHAVTLFIGMGTMYVLSGMAVIGPIFILASLFWGMGTIMLTTWETYRDARITKLI